MSYAELYLMQHISSSVIYYAYRNFGLNIRSSILGYSHIFVYSWTSRVVVRNPRMSQLWFLLKLKIEFKYGFTCYFRSLIQLNILCYQTIITNRAHFFKFGFLIFIMYRSMVFPILYGRNIVTQKYAHSVIYRHIVVTQGSGVLPYNDPIGKLLYCKGAYQCQPIHF